MLTGLAFTLFYAAAICLPANTAPVAFGSISIPSPKLPRGPTNLWGGHKSGATTESAW